MSSAGRRPSHHQVPFDTTNDAARFLAGLLLLGGLALRPAPASAQARVATGAGPGVPFGPWRLPDSLFHAPFTATVLALRPGDAIARLDAARRAHIQVFIILERSRRNHQRADKSFDLVAWKREIVAFRGVDFSSYVADGTVLGHILIDEPHDPTNWNGAPVPYAIIDSAAAFSKSLWPTLPVGVTSPPTFLAQAPLPSIDWSFAQYRPNKGEINAWLAMQRSAAERSGLALVLSINVLDANGHDAPLAASELQRIGVAMSAEPGLCALTMWKYDDRRPEYFERADVQRAVAAIAAVASTGSARSCRRR